MWRVSGIVNNAQYIRQLHLSYHNGEHYSSIRQLGDLTNKPTNIRIDGYEKPLAPNNNNKSNKQKKPEYNSYNYEDETYYDEFNGKNEELIGAFGGASVDSVANSEHLLFNNNDNSIVERIVDVTNCFDFKLINEILLENNHNVDLTISSLLQILSLKDETGKDEEAKMAKANNINENKDENEEDNKENKEENDSDGDNSDNCNDDNKNQNSTNTKQKKLSARDKKRLKKQRQMERQQIKVLEEKEKTNYKYSSNAIKCENDGSNDKGAGPIVNVENENDGNFQISLSNIEATSI